MTDWENEHRNHPLRVHERERVWRQIEKMAEMEGLDELPPWLNAARWVLDPKDPLHKDLYDQGIRRGQEIWKKLQEKNDSN